MSQACVMLCPVVRPQGTTRRSIYFYRADTGTDVSGAPRPLDISAELKAVHDRPFAGTAASGRYVNVLGDDLCVFVDSNPAQLPQRVRLARIRRSDVPQSELGGQLTPVALPEGAGLYEATHMVFFEDDIVGVEFNFYGPRPTRFEPYLRQLLGDVATPFFLEPLLRRDAESKLRAQTGLRLLQMKIRPSLIEAVRQADTRLGAALDAQLTAGQPDMLGLYLQAEPRDRSARLAPGLLQVVRSLAGRSDIRDQAEQFLVKGVGQDGRVNPIDVLSDGLISRRNVQAIPGTSRQVLHEVMYAEIEAAYGEMFDDLAVAASLGGDIAGHLPVDSGQ
jgi:hypothetical protein